MLQHRPSQDAIKEHFEYQHRDLYERIARFGALHAGFTQKVLSALFPLHFDGSLNAHNRWHRSD